MWELESKKRTDQEIKVEVCDARVMNKELKLVTKNYNCPWRTLEYGSKVIIR